MSKLYVGSVGPNMLDIRIGLVEKLKAKNIEALCSELERPKLLDQISYCRKEKIQSMVIIETLDNGARNFVLFDVETGKITRTFGTEERVVEYFENIGRNN